MPYTVLEAMMCGRPTVSTDVGGVAEAVGDAGLVVPPRDPRAFGEACVALLTSPRLRAETGDNGRQRALREYTLDRCLTAYHGRYLDLTGRRVTASAPVRDGALVPV
jgi:polysaccharide biosynthesis protein PelF